MGIYGDNTKDIRGYTGITLRIYRDIPGYTGIITLRIYGIYGDIGG